MSAVETIALPSALKSSQVSELEWPLARILLAEDDREMRLLLCEVLEEAGYEVLEVCDGTTLEEILSSSFAADYDLIITDVRMKGQTGFEAIEKLRERSLDHRVVFITAFGCNHFHRRARELGATMLDKPFDPDELLEHVRARLAYPLSIPKHQEER